MAGIAIDLRAVLLPSVRHAVCVFRHRIGGSERNTVNDCRPGTLPCDSKGNGSSFSCIIRNRTVLNGQVCLVKCNPFRQRHTDSKRKVCVLRRFLACLRLYLLDNLQGAVRSCVGHLQPVGPVYSQQQSCILIFPAASVPSGVFRLKGITNVCSAVSISVDILVPDFVDTVFVLVHVVLVREHLDLVNNSFPSVRFVQENPVISIVKYRSAVRSEMILGQFSQTHFISDHRQIVFVLAVGTGYPAADLDIYFFHIPVGTDPFLLYRQGCSGSVQHPVLVLRCLQGRNLKHSSGLGILRPGKPGDPLPADGIQAAVIHLGFLKQVLVFDDDNIIFAALIKPVLRQTVVPVVFHHLEMPGAAGVLHTEGIVVVNVNTAARVIADPEGYAVFLPAVSDDFILVCLGIMINDPPHQLQLDNHIPHIFRFAGRGVQAVIAGTGGLVIQELFLQVHLDIARHLVQDFDFPMAGNSSPARLLEMDRIAPAARVLHFTVLVSFDLDDKVVIRRVRQDPFTGSVLTLRLDRGLNRKVPVFLTVAILFRQFNRALPGPVVRIIQHDMAVVGRVSVFTRIRCCMPPSVPVRLPQGKGYRRVVRCFIKGNAHPFLGHPEGLQPQPGIGDRHRFGFIRFDKRVCLIGHHRLAVFPFCFRGQIADRVNDRQITFLIRLGLCDCVCKSVREPRGGPAFLMSQRKAGHTVIKVHVAVITADLRRTGLGDCKVEYVIHIRAVAGQQFSYGQAACAFPVIGDGDCFLVTGICQFHGRYLITD